MQKKSLSLYPMMIDLLSQREWSLKRRKKKNEAKSKKICRQKRKQAKKKTMKGTTTTTKLKRMIAGHEWRTQDMENMNFTTMIVIAMCKYRSNNLSWIELNNKMIEWNERRQRTEILEYGVTLGIFFFYLKFYIFEINAVIDNVFIKKKMFRI